MAGNIPKVPLLKILSSTIIWVAFLILRTLLIFLGWLVVPIAVMCNAFSFRVRTLAGKPVHFWYFDWKWMWIWGNDEEGIAWYDTFTLGKKKIVFKSLRAKIIYTSCFRNPANNLRYVPFLSCKIDPARVKWVGGPHGLPASYDLKPGGPEWFFCWCGWYSNFWLQFKMFQSVWRLWIGWKVFPYDVYGVTDHRKTSAGFATQFKRLK